MADTSSLLEMQKELSLSSGGKQEQQNQTLGTEVDNRNTLSASSEKSSSKRNSSADIPPESPSRFTSRRSSLGTFNGINLKSTFRRGTMSVKTAIKGKEGENRCFDLNFGEGSIDGIAGANFVEDDKNPLCREQRNQQRDCLIMLHVATRGWRHIDMFRLSEGEMLVAIQALPTFSGDDPNDSVVVWLLAIEMLFQIECFAYDVWVSLAWRRLRGRALHWWILLVAKAELKKIRFFPTRWEDFKVAMIAEFPTVMEKETIKKHYDKEDSDDESEKKHQ